ncbi:MAG: terpene cyclase/mutase family protein [Planctomycetes bacterium]|nr:terpene cyclase/mutase family protein [Planctomycetota bacterium]
MKSRTWIILIIGVVAIGIVAVTARRAKNTDDSKVGSGTPGPSAVPDAPASPKAAMLKSLRKGVQYLEASQNEDGSWGQFQAGVGITALGAHAMLISPLGLTEENTPALKKAIAFIVAHAQENGEINIVDQGLGNYNTSLAIIALNNTGNKAYDDVIKKGQKYVMSVQHDGGPDDASTGGYGYNTKRGRADISNTQWAIEALRETGLSEGDEQFKKALTFLHHVHNSSEVNSLPWAAVVNDGGAVYTPDPDDIDEDPVSKAGKVEGRGGQQGWKSYGMTYAMLKSYLYVGMEKDSPEVKLAWGWIQNNWTVDENPGLGEEGYFYYLTTFSKTLAMVNDPVVVDKDGREHRWADELAARLAKLQKEDGSWKNEASRWYEADTTLVTAYAIRSLSYAYPFASGKTSE